MTEIDLLVRADYLYPMTEGLPIIRDGEVAIAGGRIRHAGPRRPEGSWQAKRVLPGRHKAVLPGLVNCHSHAASLVFRSQTDDFSSGVGLYTIAFRMEKEIGPEEWQDLALLGCLDLLRSGVTTTNDIWYSPDRLAAAVEQSGLRAMIANKVFDVRLEALHEGDYTRDRAVGERRLKDGVRFVEEWHGKAGGRIMGRIGPHASDTCDAGLHRELRAEADRLGDGLHMHTAQSKREIDHIRATRGCGPLEYLRDIGSLAADVVCAHLTFASDGDLAAVAETGANYAHCPTIYARRGRYPRLDAIRKRGITTGFGTDWMLNDPFEGMRFAMNATRQLLGDADVLPAQEALWHQTMGSAKVLGLDQEIGSLEPGKQADLIMIELNRPHLQPFYGGYPALGFYVRASDVVTSIIDGRIVLEDGRATGIDEAAVLDAVERRLPGWAARLRALGSRMVAPDFDACCG